MQFTAVRYAPRKVYVPLTITNEPHTITLRDVEIHGNYATVYLNEIPYKGPANECNTVVIAGMTQVAGNPVTSSQFHCDYDTGIVYFVPGLDGTAININYQGIGTAIDWNTLKNGLCDSSATSNVVRVEPTLEEDIVGEIYTTYADALAYVISESPSEDNSWVIELPAGDFDENIELNQYVTVIGKNTRLVGTVSTNIFMVNSTDFQSMTTYMKNCIITKIDLSNSYYDDGSGITYIAIGLFSNCFFDIDTHTSGIIPSFLLMRDCHLLDGIYAYNTNMYIINSVISGGILPMHIGGINNVLAVGCSIVGGQFLGGIIINCVMPSSILSGGGSYYFISNSYLGGITHTTTNYTELCNCYVENFTCVFTEDSDNLTMRNCVFGADVFINFPDPTPIGFSARFSTYCCIGDVTLTGPSAIRYNYGYDVSEHIPIEVFDDGDTPPDEVAVIDTVVRYRDFDIGENIILEYPKPREYNPASPLYVALKIIVTDVGGISSGDVLQFEYKFKEIGGAFFTTVINWVADTDYPQNSVITTPLTEITDSIYDINVIELERVDSGKAVEYANKIGILYLEFVWSKI